MLDRSEIGKRGYLNEPYRLFHLRDNRALALDYHYHEFDKLVLLLGGRATYHIEGRSYPLQPMDILLVSRNLIPLPEAEPEKDNDRHSICVETIDDEYSVTMDHSMEKGHYISFIAYVTSDALDLVKLYPEQGISVRFRKKGHGIIYAYCNRHGMFKTMV